jgi:transcriptional regulator with XRE-family HTH domain
MATQAKTKERFVREKQDLARDYIQAVLDARRWTATDLARKIGVSPTTITRFVNSDDISHVMKLENLVRISEASGLPLPQGLSAAYGIGSPLVQDLDEIVEPSNVRGAPLSPNLRRDSLPKLKDDIPVYGTVQGGADGAFEMNTGEAIDWVRRPLALEGRAGLYSVYVEGDSMSPRFYAGERILVNSKKPPAIGNDVIIQIKPKKEGDPIRAYLKSLVRRNSEEIEVEQFTPPKKLKFKMAEILSLHVVLDRDETF